MFRARAAGCLDLFAQRLAGAEDADGRVVRSDPRFGGEILHRRAVHVDAADGLLVFGLQRRGQARDAAADRIAQLGRRLDDPLHLAGQHFERPIPRAVPAVVIDDGVPKGSVEPRDRGRLVADLDRLLQALHERILQDVLSQRSVAQPPLEKAEELTVVIDELEGEV